MTRLRRRLGSLLLLPGAFWLAGCHTYMPVESPAIGSMVRVRLPVTSAAGTAVRTETVSLEGTVLQAGDTISLAMSTRRELGAYRALIQLDTVRLARGETSSVELKEFSAPRSILLGAILAAGVGAAAALAFGLGGGSENEGEGPPDPVSSLSVSGSLLSSLWGIVAR